MGVYPSPSPFRTGIMEAAIGQSTPAKRSSGLSQLYYYPSRISNAGIQIILLPWVRIGNKEGTVESRPTTTDDTEDCYHVILGQIGRVSSHDWLIHGFYYSLQPWLSRP